MMGFTLQDFAILRAAGVHTDPLALTDHESADGALLVRMESPLMAAAKLAIEGVAAAEVAAVESKLRTCNFFVA